MRNIYRLLLPLIASCLLLLTCESENNMTDALTETERLLPANAWVGTYTRKEGHVDGKAAGIYHAKFTADSVQFLDTTTDIINPSYLCLHPNGKLLFAVSEIGSPEVDSSGFIYSYRIKNDKLEFVNRQPTYSFAPCYVTVHPSGKWMYVANYVGGMIVRYPLDGRGTIGMASDTLRLVGNGPNASRQEGSHPHAVTLSPGGKWLMVTDLGTDRVHTYRADAAKWEEITYTEMPPGSGPRHLAFHPKAPFAYVLNELNNTVTALHYNADNGALQIRAHYPMVPSTFTEFTLGADIHLTPDGRFLYASNRGHDSLVAYEVLADGTLKTIGHYSTRGNFPRNFVIHPSGEYLLVSNQNSDNIVQMRIDAQGGQLSFMQEWTVKTPVCVAFDK